MGLFDFFKSSQSGAGNTNRDFSEIRERARSLRQLGRYQEAITLLLNIVDSDPAVPSILGNTYKEGGDYENARKWFLRALKTAESVDPKSNLAARMLATESQAHLGELEWEQGDPSKALKHLTNATKYWTTPANSRERTCKKMALSSVTLSLMLKYAELDNGDKAYEFATHRLQYVPNCPKAKAVIDAITNAKKRSTKVSVALRFRQEKTQAIFQMTVLRFAQVTIEALKDEYGEAVSDFKVELAKDTPTAMFRCVALNCDPVEVREAIVLSWKKVTQGNGETGVPKS
jgi:tetratricopeptide (TPR) repeat protein